MADALAGTMLRVWRSVVDTITPPRCLCCHAPVGEPAALCVACWQALTFIEEPVCNVLGTPFAYAQGAGAVSPAAIARPPAWDRARAAVAYDDVSRPLVHALKYRDMPEAGQFMARMMARAARRLVADADVVVPVPLHRFRLWRRRFNQSAYLAQRIAAAAGLSCRSDLLARVKPTRSQVGLGEEERRRNVARAFAVADGRQGEIAGKSVLLVDDVMTTGATAGACAAALRQAGARQVDVACFALVLEPARFHI